MSAASLAMWRPDDRRDFLARLTQSEARALLDSWAFWARDAQWPPQGDWRTWVFLGGRGAGKTRAGAEWVKAQALAGASRIALVAPTLHDAREVMIEGASGLRSLSGERPVLEPSRRRLVWANGAEARYFSAEDPESLRGPQFDAAWGDEFCFWAHPEDTLSALRHGLRLGARPRLMMTTTPRFIPALIRLLDEPDTARTQAATFENAANLAADFTAALHARWTGSARDRQELLGELVEDLPGALWRREQLERLRVLETPAFERIVVAVDPPVSLGPDADACGIIAAGAYGFGRDRRAIVLADATVQGASPEAWALRAASLAHSLGAHAIIAEANQGGEMVRSTLRMAAGDTPIILVRADRAKAARAYPVSALYAQGRVAHRGAMPALEDEMCGFGAEGRAKSPDRVDALVWALSDLLLHEQTPQMRRL